MSLMVGYVPNVHFAHCLMSYSNILTICTQCVQPEKKENVDNIIIHSKKKQITTGGTQV